VNVCREFQARVTRQVAAARPEPQSEMFAATDEPPARERTTLGNLRARGRNARVPVNRAAASSTSRL